MAVWLQTEVTSIGAELRQMMKEGRGAEAGRLLLELQVAAEFDALAARIAADPQTGGGRHSEEWLTASAVEAAGHAVIAARSEMGVLGAASDRALIPGIDAHAVSAMTEVLVAITQAAADHRQQVNRFYSDYYGELYSARSFAKRGWFGVLEGLMVNDARTAVTGHRPAMDDFGNQSSYKTSTLDRALTSLALAPWLRPVKKVVGPASNSLANAGKVALKSAVASISGSGGAAGELTEAAIMRALRQEGTVEAAAIAKYLKRGNARIVFRPSDYTGAGKAAWMYPGQRT